jgi:hypothetical protein
MNCVCGNPLDNSLDGLHCFFCFMAQEQSRNHTLALFEEFDGVDEQEERDDQMMAEDFAALDELEDYYTSLELDDEYVLLVDD